MDRHSWTIVCLAYIVGLLSAAAADFLELNRIALIIVSGSLSSISTYLISYLNHRRFKTIIYLLALTVSVFAGFYWEVRIPHPLTSNISHHVLKTQNPQLIVEGTVIGEPRLTTNHKLQFSLQTTRVGENRDRLQPTSGKLYVTLPLLQGTGIYPGEKLDLKGVLYQPQESNYPGEFDFRTYLARRGVFAGIKVKETIYIGDRGETKWGWWKLRRRVVRTHLQALGSPVGQMVSSMVLGRKAVDLPSEIRDSFVKAGLAHVLAASGFHVSLLLGIVLKLTNRLAAKSQFIIGLGVLIVYVGLTGLQPSIVRAALMGTSLLIATATDSKVRSLGSLLLAATIILLFNPLWISDVGFQLSFLATFGLIVTLPSLQTKLDWLPPTIATAIAIPIAASIWVLPLLAYVFHTLTLYSLPVNIIATPLVTLVIVGGIISGFLALIIPILGTAFSMLLYYPAVSLMKMVELFGNLPGSAISVGNISLFGVLIIYGLLGFVCLSKWWQHRWKLSLITILIATTIVLSFDRLDLTVANNPHPFNRIGTNFDREW